MREINLFFHNTAVGIITFKDDEYQMKYEENWINEGFQISPALEFKTKTDSISIKHFLDNLIPEGQALEDLVEHYKISKQNIIRITELIGHDAVGAIKFTNEVKVNSFREVTESELSKRLNERSTRSLLFWDEKLRLSAAGVQDKLTVTILNKKIGFGEGDIASTHILKFEKENNKFKNLVLNEYFCMQLAKKIGLDVCETEFKRVGDHPVLFVKRFDRDIVSGNLVKRIHQIDGCQALNLSKTYKYEKNFGSTKDVDHIRDGVSFNKLINFSYRTKVPAITISKILKWMIFNYLISNFDAHGKNISFFISSKGIELTPFYDLVCISLYDVEHEFAMGIDGEFKLSDIKAFQFSQFCEENEINKKLLIKIIKDVTSLVMSKLDSVDLPNMDQQEEVFVDKLKSVIKKQVQQLESIWPDIDKM